MAGADAHLGAASVADNPSEIRHNLAYDAARGAAQAAMAAEGYRAAGEGGHHQSVFDFLALVDEGKWEGEADYLNVARQKRNRSQYEEFGLIGEAETEELLEVASRFVAEVGEWLREKGILPEE
jgi:hypothetical protein